MGKNFLVITLILFFLFIIIFFTRSKSVATETTDQVGVFYYGWYATEECDGYTRKWNEAICQQPFIGEYGNRCVTDELANELEFAADYAILCLWYDENLIVENLIRYADTGKNFIILIDGNCNTYQQTMDAIKLARNKFSGYSNWLTVYDKQVMVFYGQAYQCLTDSELVSILDYATSQNFVIADAGTGQDPDLIASNSDGIFVYVAGHTYQDTCDYMSRLSEIADRNNVWFVPTVNYMCRGWDGVWHNWGKHGKFGNKVWDCARQYKRGVDHVWVVSFNEHPECTGILPCENIEQLTLDSQYLWTTRGQGHWSNIIWGFYYGILLRQPDLGGFNWWADGMKNSNDKLATAKTIGMNFVKSDEFKNYVRPNHTCEELVAGFYRGLLDRKYDQSGFDFYVNYCESNDKCQAACEDIVHGMLYSPEFAKRF
jgi:hypothetical protein